MLQVRQFFKDQMNPFGIFIRSSAAEPDMDIEMGAIHDVRVEYTL